MHTEASNQPNDIEILIKAIVAAVDKLNVALEVLVLFAEAEEEGRQLVSQFEKRQKRRNID